MSGGHWDYRQFAIADIADDLEHIADEWEWTEDTKASLRAGARAVRIAYAHIHRADWLVSGDDSEETYHERLQTMLDKIKEESRE